MSDAPNPVPTTEVVVSSSPDAKLAPKAPPEPPVKDPIVDPKALKKWTLQFGENDKEEVDEETLLKYAQKARGADKAFQSAAAQRKEVEAVIQALKDSNQLPKVILNKALGHDPKAVLSGIIKQALDDGYDMKEIKDMISDQLYEWIQEENLDPKEKENRELKKRLEKIEAEKKSVEEEKQKALFEQMTQEAYKKFDTDITETLKTSGLPKTSYTVKQVAYYLDQAYKVKQEFAQQGIEIKEPSAKDVIQYVRNDYEQMIKELYGQADVETLIKLLGEETLNKVRKHDVEKLKQSASTVQKSKSKVESPFKKESKKEEPKQKAKNFFKQREEEIRNMERGA